MTNLRTLAIVNPHGGRRHGLAILDQVKPIFSAAGHALEVRLTECPQHARDMVRTAPLDQYGKLCVLGGDGTVHEVVAGLLLRSESASIPLGIIPAGTGNDMAKQLGIANALEGARRIVAGRTAAFDVMRVAWEDQIDYCVTLIGWTGVADINQMAERLRILGPARYAFAALLQILAPKRRRATIVLDGQSIEDRFMLVVACNTMFTGSGMRLAPRARVDDGKIDVVMLRKASRWQMLRMLAKVYSGTHVDMPCIEYRQVRTMRILTDHPGPLDIDGEVKGSAPLEIQVLPGALRVFAASDSSVIDTLRHSDRSTAHTLDGP